MTVMKRRRTTEEIRESKRKLREEIETIKQEMRTALIKGIEDGTLDPRQILAELAAIEHNKPSPKR
jgi:hypothetical protein